MREFLKFVKSVVGERTPAKYGYQIEEGTGEDTSVSIRSLVQGAVKTYHLSFPNDASRTDFEKSKKTRENAKQCGVTMTESPSTQKIQPQEEEAMRELAWKYILYQLRN